MVTHLAAAQITNKTQVQTSLVFLRTGSAASDTYWEKLASFIDTLMSFYAISNISRNPSEKKSTGNLMFYSLPFGKRYILRYMLQVFFAVFSPQSKTGT